jgi:hypothetical protein
MEVWPDGFRAARRCLAAALAVLLVLAGAATAGAQPRATAADVNYGPLTGVGVSASGASVTGRDISVRIRLRRRAGIRLAVVNGDEIRGYTKRVLAPGSYLFHGQLSRVPRGTNLKLRITARLQDGRRGRQRFPIKFVAPVPSNHAPTAIGLANASVAENQPPGTSVGTLSATDADAADALTFSLVPGALDNAAFAIGGTTLRTASSFDFETKSSYSIRVRVDDGHGGSFERVFTIAVTNVNEAPVGLALAPAQVAENQPAGATPTSATASRSRSSPGPAPATTPRSRSRARRCGPRPRSTSRRRRPTRSGSPHPTATAASPSGRSRSPSPTSTTRRRSAPPLVRPPTRRTTRRP